MPRYAITTFLNKKQQARLEKARKKLNNMSRYKFLQKAIMAYCTAVEKEKIEIDRKNGEGEASNGGIETGRQRTLEVSY